MNRRHLSTEEILAEFGATCPQDRASQIEFLGEEDTQISRVIAVEVRGNKSAQRQFIKVPSGMDPFSESKSEFERTKEFGSFFSDISSEFRAVTPIRILPRSGALVVSAAKGVSLASLFANGASWLAFQVDWDACRNAVGAVGRWVAYLEESSKRHLSLPDVKNRFQASFDEAFSRISQFRNTLSDVEMKCCFDAIEREFAGPDDVEVYLAHGDLHAGNVFVSMQPSSQVTAIDLALSSLRPCGYDAIFFDFYLASQLGWRHCSPQGRRQLRRLFWSQYGTSISALPFRQTMALWCRITSLRYIVSMGDRQPLVRQTLWQLESKRLCRSIARLASR